MSQMPYTPPLDLPEMPAPKKRHVGRTIALVIAGLFVLGVLAEIGNSTDKGAVTGTNGGPVVSTFSESIDGKSVDLIEVSADLAWDQKSPSDQQLLCTALTVLPREQAIASFQNGSGWTHDQSAYAVDYTDRTYC